MRTKMLFPLAAAALMLIASSCSKDDHAPDDPAATVTLNMLNEQNGKTVLGNSGVYINGANNFYGGYSSCLIADAGAVSGIGALGEPVLSNLSQQVAVTPGHGYFLCDREAMMEFPSGAYALMVGAGYYKVYVASWLAEDKGAVVKYLLARPAQYGLPEYDSGAGTLESMEATAVIEMPTSDFEYLASEEAGWAFRFEKKGRTLSVSLQSGAVSNGDYDVYLRIGATYTRVYVRVMKLY